MLATRRLRHLAHRFVFPARELPAHSRLSDAHLHTTQTDGRSSVQEMLAAAARQGLSRIAFTEHVRRGITWFPGFRAEVARAAQAFPQLEILVGIEAKALDFDAGLDADPGLVAEAALVLGAFHNYPDGLGGFLPASELSQEQAAMIEFEASYRLLDHPEVDVLAHPGALTCRHFGAFPDAFLQVLVRKAARQGRAIELNGEYNSPDQLARLLELCRREDAWVSCGSNAHEAGEVGRIARQLKEVRAYAH
jgi:histidinol phosphatase-like PHP family hydrolase